MSSPATPLTLQKRRAGGPQAPARPKLYLIHDGSGTVANYTKLQDLDCDVYGIQDPRLMSSQPWLGGVPEMARQYAHMIQTTSPNSAVVLGGWSFGGLVAVQTAHELQRARAAVTVQGIILMETVFPAAPAQTGAYAGAWPGLAAIRSPLIRDRVTRSIAQSVRLMDAWEPPPVLQQQWAVVLLRAKECEPTGEGAGENAARLNGLRSRRYLGWEEYDAGFVTRLMEVEGSHLTMFEERNLPSLTNTMKRAIDYCQGIEE